MKANRGDVVLVDFPYSDRTGSKLRPCLVVQADGNNRRLDDGIFVSITSRTHLASTESTQVLIAKESEAGKQSGLLHDSAIVCESIATIDWQFVARRIGKLPAEDMVRVESALKASLGIA